MAETLMRIARSKPLHFVLGGMAMFVLLDRGAASRGAPEPLTLDPARVEQLGSAWAASMGSAPSAAELVYLERQELDDEILFREALARSLHELDPVVRQRVLLNMRFLGAAQDADDEELFREGLRLGMHLNDVVVRRRLVQIMQMSIEQGAARGPVDNAELEAMYAERRAELTIPERWRITQVYFSRDRRGERAGADARRAQAAILAQKLQPGQAIALGDPFLGGHRLPLLNAVQLGGQFGDTFPRALAGCAAAQWCGPVESSFGVHLVFVEEHVETRVPAIDEPEVQKRLLADIQRRRAERRLADAMEALRKKYGVNT